MPNVNADNHVRVAPQAFHRFAAGAFIFFDGPEIVPDFFRVPLYPVRRHTKEPAMRKNNPGVTDLGLDPGPSSGMTFDPAFRAT